MEFTVLKRMIRKVLTEKIAFKPRLEGDKGISIDIFGEIVFQVEEVLKLCSDSYPVGLDHSAQENNKR